MDGGDGFSDGAVACGGAFFGTGGGFSGFPQLPRNQNFFLKRAPSEAKRGVFFPLTTSQKDWCFPPLSSLSPNPPFFNGNKSGREGKRSCAHLAETSRSSWRRRRGGNGGIDWKSGWPSLAGTS